MDEATRGAMESAFGQSFGDVKIHEGDGVAESAGAQAVARGSDVHFAAGKYDPESKDGKFLLGHELTHVVQQRAGATNDSQAQQLDDAAASTSRTPLEHEADQVGERVAAGESAGDVVGGAPFGTAQNFGPDEGPDVLPPAIAVTWGGDPFKLAFRRVGDDFFVDILYTGGKPTGTQFGNQTGAQTLRYGLGSKKLKAKIVANAGDRVQIDLYGDGFALLNIAHAMDQLAGAREHRIRISRDALRGGDSQRITVKDPAQVAVPKPDYQDDVPGDKPQALVKNGGTQIRIDGDGDQHKELLLQLNETADKKAITVDVTQLASGAKQTVTLTKGAGGLFWPALTSITDGYEPTVIGTDPANQIKILPPTRTATTVAYMIKGPQGSAPVTFPTEPAGQGPAAVAVGTQNPVVGGIHSVDVKLGAFSDPFRLSLDPASRSFGISPVDRGGGPVDGLAVNLNLPTVKSMRLLKSDGISLALDLDEDGKPDIQVYDKLEAIDERGGTLERDAEGGRRHTVRLVGKALAQERTASFQIAWGGNIGPYSNRNDQDRAVASNARAVTGLQDQAGLGSYVENIDAFDGALFAARQNAVNDKIITPAIFDNWAALNAELIVLRAQIAGMKADPSKRIDPALQASAAAHADAFFNALAAATKGKEKVTFADGDIGYSNIMTENPYTQEHKTDSWVLFLGTKTTTDSAKRVGFQLRTSQFDGAFSAYNLLAGGLDKWIVDQLKAKHTKGGDQAAQRVEYLGAMRTELGKLEGVKPTRLQAVFHPDASYKGSREVPEVPLSLYFWRAGNEWKLKDLTNPNNTFEDSVSAGGESEPPDSLFAKLDYKSHFPKGIIHYQIPGGRGGQLKTTERKTLSDWLTYIGLGVAAIGLGLATFGTGTVAVVGAYVLAASSVIGAAAAGAHMAEEASHGNLDAGEAALDIAQIVAGLAGASQLVAGRIVMSAAAASEAGAAWTGTAARIAGWAQAGYAPLTITRIGGDIATVALGGHELAKQLEEIEKSGATTTEKSRLKALLLSQFAVTGGLVALSIKGDLPTLAKGKSLYIYAPTKGGPLTAAHMEKPGGIKFTQATIDAKTSDGLSMDELIQSMKSKGWQGDPIDIVQLDGQLISMDNRRLYAARAAGIEAPVSVHAPDAKLPGDMLASDKGRARFVLDVDIYVGADGKLTTVKPSSDAVPKYAAGASANTWGEAVTFRTANQQGLTGFGVPSTGTHATPFITTRPTTDKQKKELGLPKGGGADDVARLETKGLVEAIENGTLDKGLFNTRSSDGKSTFGEWYKRWIDSPEPVKTEGGAAAKAHYPEGMPEEFRPLIDRMVIETDIVRNVRIRAQAKALAQEIPDFNIDPYSKSYPETRKKLVDKHGEAMVKRYEAAVFGAQGPERDAINGQVKKVIDETGLDTLRAYLPGEEIYLTGGATTAGKPLTDIKSVKIMIVVPDGTSAKKIAKLETEASALLVSTSPEYAKATGVGHLRVEAEVRTRSTAFSAMTVEGGGSFVRIDHKVPTVEQTRVFADNLAHTAAPTTQADLDAELGKYNARQDEIRSNYAKVQAGEMQHPSASAARLKLAVEGDANGERIPLTYQSADQFHEFQAELQSVFSRHNITDAVVQQLGSGTTGWRGNPNKEIGPWKPTSDVDFAIFSDQALQQAFSVGAQPNMKITQGGKYTVLRNEVPGGKGFYDTPLGADLKTLAKKWNQKIYGSADVDGFDFKLNLADKPFGRAVTVMQNESVHAIGNAKLIDGAGTNKYFGVQVEKPKMAGRIAEPIVSSRENHITIIEPDEWARLPDTAKAELAAGIHLAGAPTGMGMIKTGSRGTYMMTVSWPEANALRAKYGLPPKELHVTIGKASGAAERKPPVKETPDVQADDGNGK